MEQVNVLVGRNIKVYLRNRSNVISSLLAMIIVVVLMFGFLGDQVTNAIVSGLASFGGVRDVATDKLYANYYILNWVAAGLLLVNSVTVSLSVVGIMIEDMENNKLNSMFVAPVKKSLFVFSYVISGFVVSYIMCVATLIASEAFLAMKGAELLSVLTILKVLGVLFVIVFVFSSFSFLCVLAVNSSSAFGHVGSLVGTLVGFLAAIYIPVGSLPDSAVSVMKYLPTLVGSSVFRELFTSNAAEVLYQGVPEASRLEMDEALGTALVYGGNEASFLIRMLILVVSGIIFLSVAIILMKRKHIADR